jgi:hypothetical protein
VSFGFDILDKHPSMTDYNAPPNLKRHSSLGPRDEDSLNRYLSPQVARIVRCLAFRRQDFPQWKKPVSVAFADRLFDLWGSFWLPGSAASSAIGLPLRVEGIILPLMSDNNNTQPKQSPSKPPCPACSAPLDMQRREPLLWLCALCRKWFDRQTQRLWNEYGGSKPMLIKIDNTIINIANIVSAHFTPATENLKGALTIVFVNNVETTNSLGKMLLEGDEAVQVWNALSGEAKSVSPK